MPYFSSLLAEIYKEPPKEREKYGGPAGRLGKVRKGPHKGGIGPKKTNKTKNKIQIRESWFCVWFCGFCFLVM